MISMIGQASSFARTDRLPESNTTAAGSKSYDYATISTGNKNDQVNISNATRLEKLLFGGDYRVEINGKSQFMSYDQLSKTTFDLGGGNDTLWVQADVQCPITAMGGEGNDTMMGGAGADRFAGGNGNDTLYGQGGADYLNGELGDDTIYGGYGTTAMVDDSNDYIVGGAENVPDGFSDNDTIHGEGGDDTIFAGGGIDKVYGGNGFDRVFNTDAYDTVNLGPQLQLTIHPPTVLTPG